LFRDVAVDSATQAADGGFDEGTGGATLLASDPDESGSGKAVRQYHGEARFAGTNDVTSPVGGTVRHAIPSGRITGLPANHRQ